MKRIRSQELEFLFESNRIENIHRQATDDEFFAFDKFMKLKHITLRDLEDLVFAFQFNGHLRHSPGMNVTIGNHFPPLGGMNIIYALEGLLNKINFKEISAYDAHIQYETLHPFTDGNGRSGRMIWWKMMGGSEYGFLRHFYYQTLENSNARK